MRLRRFACGLTLPASWAGPVGALFRRDAARSLWSDTAAGATREELDQQQPEEHEHSDRQNGNGARMVEDDEDHKTSADDQHAEDDARAADNDRDARRLG